MEQYNHPDCNTVLKAAPGDEDSVATLPVTQGKVGPNLEYDVVRSYWVPTDAELTLLNTGRYCVALTVIGHTHPPLRVDICDAKVNIAMLRDSSNDKIFVPPGTTH